MSTSSINHGDLTKHDDYTNRLVSKYDKSWKRKVRFLDPYRWNTKRICTGQVLEVGCGIGRNLESLGSRSIGVDHNESSILQARERGFQAYTSEEFIRDSAQYRTSFDTILMAHLLEHISLDVQRELLNTYLPYLKPGGKIVLICPQEKGYSSDATHIRWVEESSLIQALEEAGTSDGRVRSFPFPRWAGKFFIYNEFVATGTYPGR